MTDVYIDQTHSRVNIGEKETKNLVLVQVFLEKYDPLLGMILE